jgi:solute:Na+ symporter, SSS family
VGVGRIASVIAVALAVLTAKPLLGDLDQAFQYIQDFTGFFTPAIVVIFALGMFWKRTSTAGAFAAVAGGFLASAFFYFVSMMHKDLIPGFEWALGLPDMPFMNRVGWVFWICMAVCVLVSLIVPNKKPVSTLTLEGVNFKTSTAFNVLAVGVIVILIAIYTYFW